MSERSVDSIEVQLLMEAIRLKHGYDFRQYAESSLVRRVGAILSRFDADSVFPIIERVLKEPRFFDELLPHFTVNTTECFRDPEFFRALRESVLPMLETYPTLNIWVAGCSTGEEVYSMAILLREEGLEKRSTIYATDLNPEVIKVAKEGIYSSEVIKTFTKNYAAAGGKRSPSDYYTADYGHARFDRSLLNKVVFSEHNLVGDGPFVEAHLILCRNVMIYFNRELQNRVLSLFLQTLTHRGFLGLGSKETVRFSKHAEDFDVVDQNAKIFRKAPRIRLRDSVSAGSGGHS